MARPRTAADDMRELADFLEKEADAVRNLNYALTSTQAASLAGTCRTMAATMRRGADSVEKLIASRQPPSEVPRTRCKFGHLSVEGSTFCYQCYRGR